MLEANSRGISKDDEKSMPVPRESGDFMKKVIAVHRWPINKSDTDRLAVLPVKFNVRSTILRFDNHMPF